MSKTAISETTYSGPEKDSEGREHYIYRVTCNLCHEKLTEMHLYCCGFSACGFASHPKQHWCAN